MRSTHARFIVTALVVGFVGSCVGTAWAQQEEAPPGPFAIDVRGALARYGQPIELAELRGLRPDELPANGLGIDLGGHWYPIRTRRVTLGLGASLLWSRGEQAPQGAERGAPPVGPTVRTEFRALAPQLSLNFGTHRGWSYLSGGTGWSELVVTPEAAGASATRHRGRRARTLNYGGGARWFARRHLAFTFDVRFYAVSPLPDEGPDAPAQPRLTLMVVSAGVSLK